MSRRKVHHSTVPASRPVREPRRSTPRPRRSEAPVPPARVLPPGPQPRPETPAFAASHETSLAEVIDNLLNRGVVLNADLDSCARGRGPGLCTSVGAALRRGSHPAGPAMSRLNVFALTEHAAPPFTVDGHRIEFIAVGGLHAAVEHRDARPTISESALRTQHDVVMRLFERVEDLLPVRFGTWMDEAGIG